jgi:hypothetical protein
MGPAHLGIGFAAKPVAPKVPGWLQLHHRQHLGMVAKYTSRDYE